MAIKATTLKFLTDLEAHNDREWFAANKDRYLAAVEDVKALSRSFYNAWTKVEAVPPQDPDKALFRIYREVRFSKNKNPYKAWLSLEIKRAPGCMGMYLHVQPGNKSMIATGLWEPSPAQLAAARQEIDYQAPVLRKILSGKKLSTAWGPMAGDQLKTAPKGYEKDDPNVDLLRYKQFMLLRYFKDKELSSPTLVKDFIASFQAARPFMDFFDAPLKELAAQGKGEA
ncbi:MAG: TIGR02453 family protein [Bacteroidetes bacterium]|nr:TIGR02453 family protein [Bacteroidota bacterium]